MKTSFKSNEIAHIWAHQSAPHGKSPGAMSFNGPAFLSYGTEIARHITHKGKVAIIYNEHSYSHTTSKNQKLLKQAIPSGVPLFYFDNGERGDSLYSVNGKDLFEYAVEKAADAEQGAARARKNGDYYRAQMSDWLSRAQFINEFFGLRRKVDAAVITRLKEAKERAERAAQKAEEKRVFMERQEQQAGYDAWMRGEDGEYFNPRNFPTVFRVEGDELVSTHGARVPLHEARVAYRFVIRKRAQGWHRNGETCPVGHYQLDAINEHGVVAGCHRISWAELDRLESVLA